MIQKATTRKTITIFLLTWMLPIDLVLSVAAEPAPAGAKMLSPYVCHTANGRIKIDGKLDDFAWQRAKVIDSFLLFPSSPKGGIDLPHTSIRLLWDQKALYMAWRAEDVDIWSFSDQNDDYLWRGDVVELFIKPSPTNRRYYEFVIAPNGAVYDARYTSRGAGGKERFKGWNAKVKVATEIKGTEGNHSDQDLSYTGEIAIPWVAFAEAGPPPTSGSTWHFGVFRIDFSHRWEKELLLSSVPGTLKNGFHSYEKYRSLRFESH